MIEKSGSGELMFVTLGNGNVEMSVHPHITGGMIKIKNSQDINENKVVIITKTLESALALKAIADHLVSYMEYMERETKNES